MLNPFDIHLQEWIILRRKALLGIRREYSVQVVEVKSCLHQATVSSLKFYSDRPLVYVSWTYPSPASIVFLRFTLFKFKKCTVHALLVELFPREALLHQPIQKHHKMMSSRHPESPSMGASVEVAFTQGIMVYQSEQHSHLKIESQFTRI